MVFHWGLSDNKSPQVSRTLLSILPILNNVVVWMVSTRPLISKSSSPCTNPFVTVPRALITIGIIVTFMFHSFFNSLARSRYLSVFSHSFIFILWSAWTAKSTILQVFFFFFLLIVIIWLSDRDLAIRLYLEIPKEFMRLILWDRFWVVHIQFVCLVKPQLLAEFAVDHLAHPVVPILL